jgi:hypothetical protein
VPSVGGSPTNPFARSWRIGSSFDLVFSPDDGVIATFGRNVVLWDARRRRRIASAHPFSHPASMAFTPTGAILVVRNTAGKTVTLDSSTLDLVADLGNFGARDGCGPAVVTDTSFVEATTDGRLLVRSLQRGSTVVEEAEPGAMITQMAVSSDRSLVAYGVAMPGDDAEVQVRIRRWPFDEHQPHVVRSTPGGLPWAIALGDHDRVATIVGDRLSVWSTTDGAVQAEVDLPIGGTGPGLAWRPGHPELVACYEHRAIGLDLDLQATWSLDLPYACSAAFSSDGRVMALGSWERGIVGLRADGA